MGKEINLLRRLPPTAKRGPRHDAATGPDPADQEIACRYGADYFDGDRRFGYGGYRYDGRWIPVAVDIIKHFDLKIGDRILDVGCAKGYLVGDLLSCGMDAYGLDISVYALKHCDQAVVGSLHHGSATSLPFPDRSFDAVISINTIHNLDPYECVAALQEIERVCKTPGRAFVQVDAYHDEVEKERFLAWMLTAKTHGPPAFWRGMFEAAGYTGDYFWTIN